MAHKGVTAGPLRDFRWGGLVLTPTMDGESEYKTSDREYEFKKSGNGDTYSESQAVVGYVQQDIVMTAAEYEALQELQDGEARAGTATLPNGSVLSLDCGIDGELTITNGVVSLKLSGSVTVQ